jgi:hypothetical protein
MPQFRNFGGRRYFKSLSAMRKSYALEKAKARRKRGMLARVSPDPDHRGYYAVYTAKKRR